MKKVFLFTVVLASVALISCDAFKESYDNQVDASVARENGDDKIPGDGNDEIAEFDSDKTLCEPVEGIEVEKIKDAGSVSDSTLAVGEDALNDVSASAEKLGSYTTKVVVKADDTELSLTVKQTSENDFSLCSVDYKGLQVKSGKLDIDRFNESDDSGSVINSATFSFTFEEASSGSAVKVMSRLMAQKKKKLITVEVEGSYHTKDF